MTLDKDITRNAFEEFLSHPSINFPNSPIREFIDVIPNEERTVEYVKSKIKDKNINKLDNEKKRNVSNFSTRTQGK